ncbi:MAG: hypothetical protein KC656_12305 [Myxococcales bacterium]|nr:hypothetical protein [Myxococcales bacterium]MCB9671110.1 hypothetical protein [Alphaproteobacteria bacterium]
MTDLANTYDTTGTSPVDERGPARLRPSTFEARLREAQALLEGAGCTVDASGWLGGAYHGNRVDGLGGEDASGALLSGSVRLDTKVLTGDLGGVPLGGTVGSADGRFRFVMDRDADTFFVGQAARVQGARGVFMGLEASCPAGTFPETALAGWYTGEMAGLDGLQPNALLGGWTIDFDCPFIAVGGQTTWTVYEIHPGLLGIDSPRDQFSGLQLLGYGPEYRLPAGGQLGLILSGDTFVATTWGDSHPLCFADGIRVH